MLLKTGRNIRPYILILLAVGFLWTGCGKKAPPRPPLRDDAPAAVGRLGKTINGDTLRLNWNPIAGKGPAAAGFYVYRSKTRLADSNCPTCPVLFERVAVISNRKMGTDAAAPGPLEYQEPLESGYRYIYKVTPYSQSGLTGKDSGMVAFEH